VRQQGYTGFEDLQCSLNDARLMSEALRLQKGSRLFVDAKVTLLNPARATAAGILSALEGVRKSASRDDWMVLFLSGHGYAVRRRGVQQPGSFFYVCADTDAKKPDSHLTSRKLYDALAGLRCHKLVIIDACRSGDVAITPLRDLTRDGVPLLIFSACDPGKSALEPKNGKHGLFTQCLLEALGAQLSDTARQQAGQELRLPGGKPLHTVLSADQLARSIRGRLRELLEELKLDDDAQTPVFFPRQVPKIGVLCKP
jgi:uncharacterized caspase-like protein